MKVIWTLFTPLILKVSLSFNILQFYYVAPRWELLFILLAVCKCSWIYYIIFFVILEMFLAIISSNSAPSPFSPFLDSNYVYLRPYHCALLAYWHFSCITKFYFFILSARYFFPDISFLSWVQDINKSIHSYINSCEIILFLVSKYLLKFSLLAYLLESNRCYLNVSDNASLWTPHVSICYSYYIWFPSFCLFKLLVIYFCLPDIDLQNNF